MRNFSIRDVARLALLLVLSAVLLSLRASAPASVYRFASHAELRGAASEGTGPLVVLGSAGDDMLKIDFSQGSPIPAGGLRYDGSLVYPPEAALWG